MKKVILIIAALAFVAALASCSGKEEKVDYEKAQAGEIVTRSPDGIPICGTKAPADTTKVKPHGNPICGTKAPLDTTKVKPHGNPICGTK